MTQGIEDMDAGEKFIDVGPYHGGRNISANGQEVYAGHHGAMGCSTYYNNKNYKSNKN